MEVPYKKSKLMGFELEQLKSYIVQLDKDIEYICLYLRRFPETYEQAAEPVVQTGSNAFWKDTDNDKYYFIKDINGVQKTIELT